MFNIIGESVAKRFEKQKQLLDNFFWPYYLPFAHSASDFFSKRDKILLECPEDLEKDYVGKWEDAFLKNGYEFGKHSFLTNFVIMAIRRHGFVVKYNRDPEITPSDYDKNINAYITGLFWKEQTCIPDKDIKGNPVLLGVTDPRLYLPDVVIKLLDLEFGYDKELNGVI